MSNWIKCSDRLPELSHPIEVTPLTDYCIAFYGSDDRPNVKACMYDHKEKKWLTQWMEEITNVICWMPLLKIPKL